MNWLIKMVLHGKAGRKIKLTGGKEQLMELDM